jgi:hypothetical protein
MPASSSFPVLQSEKKKVSTEISAYRKHTGSTRAKEESIEKTESGRRLYY